MWAYRARSEHETAANYLDLAERLHVAGGPVAQFGDRVDAAHRDELRHHEICAEMAGRFGHVTEVAELPKARRIAPHDLLGAARLAYEMVAHFCVTESVNATLLLRSWEKATNEDTRRVLRALLADEIEHGRIGWAYLASDANWRDELAVRMPLVLKATTHDDDFLVTPSPYSSSAALVAHGMLPRDALRAVFREAMEDIVLPGLDHCSVGTADAREWFQGLLARWRD
jgi:hypothetical protein